MVCPHFVCVCLRVCVCVCVCVCVDFGTPIGHSFKMLLWAFQATDHSYLHFGKNSFFAFVVLDCYCQGMFSWNPQTKVSGNSQLAQTIPKEIVMQLNKHTAIVESTMMREGGIRSLRYV